MKKILTALLLIGSMHLVAQVTPTFDDISIQMRDGEFLSADVYIPSGVDSCQVILIQTPYNKDNFENGLPLGIGSNLNGQPYGFVVVDWRGFYGSSGADLSNFVRGEDGYDIIQWITEQIWHLDRVGTWGPSALGKVQYDTAKEQHPNHTCAVPLVAHPQFSYQDYFYGGVLEESRLNTLDALGYGLSPIVLSNPYYSPTWQFAENASWYPSQIVIPTLQIGGWYDHNINQMMEWYEATRNLSAASVQDEQWLLIGPWSHGGTGTAYVGSTIQGELTYPNAAGVNDDMALDFFDYYLLDQANNWQNTDLITYYEVGANNWKTSNASTINEALSDVLYLNPSGLLNTTTNSGSSTFTADPSNPSPTIGGQTLALGLDQGPYDQITLASRNDVITFETGVLYADATITGRAVANLFVSANQADCDISIRMVDVYPDNRNMLINDGVQRMRFRNGYTQADEVFMTSGQVYPISVTLPFTHYTWKAGHRIKIYISANNSERWNVNLQDGGTMYQAGTGNIADITIHHDNAYPSNITLPGNNSSLGIAANNFNPINIFPNPANEVLNIEGAEIIHYEITDISGKHIKSGDQSTVDINELKTGMYVIKIVSEQGVQQFQFVKV